TPFVPSDDEAMQMPPGGEPQFIPVPDDTFGTGDSDPVPVDPSSLWWNPGAPTPSADGTITMPDGTVLRPSVWPPEPQPNDFEVAPGLYTGLVIPPMYFDENGNQYEYWNGELRPVQNLQSLIGDGSTWSDTIDT